MSSEMQPEVRRLDELRRRAGEGDAKACIELGDLLLAMAPYASRRWEEDADLRNLETDLGYADLRANDAFEVMTVYGRDASLSERVTEDYLSWEQVVTRAKIGIARRKEELGRETPGRREVLSEAFHWFHRASEMGDPQAMNRLAWRYSLGQGTEVDQDRAEFWWRAADVRNNA